MEFKYSLSRNLNFSHANFTKKNSRLYRNDTLPQLYRRGRPISKEKKNDLMKLFKYIPPIYHQFYGDINESKENDDVFLYEDELLNDSESDDEESVSENITIPLNLTNENDTVEQTDVHNERDIAPVPILSIADSAVDRRAAHGRRSRSSATNENVSNTDCSRQQTTVPLKSTQKRALLRSPSERRSRSSATNENVSNTDCSRQQTTVPLNLIHTKACTPEITI